MLQFTSVSKDSSVVQNNSNENLCPRFWVIKALILMIQSIILYFLWFYPISINEILWTYSFLFMFLGWGDGLNFQDQLATKNTLVYELLLGHPSPPYIFIVRCDCIFIFVLRSLFRKKY